MCKRFVVWGCGFIGRHLVELLQKDNEVFIVNKVGRTELSNLENVTELREEQINEVEQADVMYFLAWNGTSGDKRGDIDVQLANVRLVCRAVQYAADLQCRRFVYAGSIMEYEAIKYINMDESSPGLNYIYSVSKLTADYFAKIIANKLGIEYCNALISNVYGPGEKSQRFIVSMCKKLLNNETLALTEGNQLYDFIFISDAVQALKIIGLYGQRNHTYYIGNVLQFPLKDFIIRMKEIVGSNSDILFGAIDYLGASLNYDEFNVVALGDLGFECEVSFEEGIRRTVEWLKNENKGT